MAEPSELLILRCSCGQKMKIPAQGMGRTFKCVRCGAHIKVSEENTAAIPAEAPVSAPATAKAPDPGGEGAGTAAVPATPEASVPIGQLFVDNGLITAEQLEEALSRQNESGGKTFEILLELGHLDKDELHAFLSRQPRIATIDLSRCNISNDLVALVPKKLAVENLVLPIDQLGKLLTVAMACPLDVATIKTLEATTGLRVKAMLCKLDDLHAAVQKYYPDRKQFELSASSFENLPGVSVTKIKVEDKLKKWDGMLLSPDRIKDLSEKISSADVTIDLVVAIALNEPAFGAVLLRVANSDLFNMRGQVDSIPMAVALLGKPGVQRVLSELLEPAEPNGLAIIEPWSETSRRTAQIAQLLSRECGAIGAHAAYSLGLVMDLGRMALAMMSPLQYKRLKAEAYGEHLSQAEQKLFTMDHCAVGATMAAEWHFPAPMVRALQFYQYPEDAKEAEPVARLLGLAYGLAHMNGADRDKQLAAYGSSIDKLGLTPQVIDRIAQTIA